MRDNEKTARQVPALAQVRIVRCPDCTTPAGVVYDCAECGGLGFNKQSGRCHSCHGEGRSHCRTCCDKRTVAIKGELREAMRGSR